MVDIPIIFSAPMVRALLDGRKTQTRRLAWGKPMPGLYESGGGPLTPILRPSPWQKAKPGDRLWVRENYAIARCSEDAESGGDACYFEWDKEFGDAQPHLGGDPRSGSCATLHYEADGENANPAEFHDWRSIDDKRVLHKQEIPWRPSIHMFRWASRLTLTVEEVKIEKLQAISPDDAWNEGVNRQSQKVRQMWLFGANADERECIYKQACVWEFEELWRSLHGQDSWEANPDVVAIAFRVVKGNIDRVPA